MVYFGSRALPLLSETISYTKKAHTANRENEQKRLDALEQIANGETESVAANAAAPASVAEEATAPAQVSQTIVIDESSLTQAYDPAAEERIWAMMIPETTKRQIISNYRRTGYLPDALSAKVAGDRVPAGDSN